jgi:hypothetical protein
MTARNAERRHGVKGSFILRVNAGNCSYILFRKEEQC